MRKDNDLEFKTKLMLFVLKLKCVDKEPYNEKETFEDTRYVYVFKNYEELKTYIYSSGVKTINEEDLNDAILHIEKDGKILICKSDYYDFIKFSKITEYKPKKLVLFPTIKSSL